MRISFAQMRLRLRRDSSSSLWGGAGGFKKEVEAAKELLILEWEGKALPTVGPERQVWKKRLQVFLRKFEGTQAAARAKKLS